MNEYTIYYLNGITGHVLAEDWKDSILEGKMEAQRRGFEPRMKYIVDEDSNVIRHIDEETLTYSPGLLNDIIKV